MDDILTNAIAVLSTTPQHWAYLVQTLPDALFRRQAADGQWSALECLHHLAAVENVFFYRLGVFLNNTQEIPGYNPDAPENHMDSKARAKDLAAEYIRRRETSLQALQNVTKGMLPRKARHAELGEVTLEQMLHEWAAHDLNHTVQAERALMQPFIQGSGPWLQYFADHLIPQS